MSKETYPNVVDNHFVYNFDAIQERSFSINCKNGWWEERNKIIESGMSGAVPIVAVSCLGLVTSEVAEAMEAVRKHNHATWSDAQTKDTFVRELAGTVVRCMDTAARFKLPLAQAILEEITLNASRGYKHGGKAA